MTASSAAIDVRQFSKESKLADLRDGLRVKLTLSLDRTRVFLDAEGDGPPEERCRPKPQRRFGLPF